MKITYDFEHIRRQLYNLITGYVEKGYYFEMWIDYYYFVNNVVIEGELIYSFWINKHTEGVKKTICIKYKVVNGDRFTMGEICLRNNRKTYKLPEYKRGIRGLSTFVI